MRSFLNTERGVYMTDKTDYHKINKQLKAEIDYKAIGNHMKSVRMKRKMTQEEVAEKMKWGTKYYSSIEAGKAKISLVRLIQFIGITQISADTLLKGCYSDYPSQYASTDDVCQERLELNKLLDQCSDEIIKTVLIITQGLNK